MKVIVQRGDAFIVQLDGDASLGVARVYDGQIKRLHPPYPIDELLAAPGWELPQRVLTEDEIASAEQVAALDLALELRGAQSF